VTVAALSYPALLILSRLSSRQSGHVFDAACVAPKHLALAEAVDSAEYTRPGLQPLKPHHVEVLVGREGLLDAQ